MTTLITQTLETARQVAEQHNTVENRAYAGAAAGVGIAYMASGSLIGGAVGGAAGFVTFPVYYSVLGEEKPQTERVAKAAALSFATGYVAPTVVLWAVGAVSTVLLGAGVCVLGVGLIIHTKFPELENQLAKVPRAVSHLLNLVN